MQILPNTLSRFVDNVGKIVTPWIQYLQQFTQAPPPFVSLDVDISPFSYTAVEPGFIFIDAGAVSAVHLIRGAGNADFTGQKTIPVSIGDTVVITYSVLPDTLFIPIYGAAPR